MSEFWYYLDEKSEIRGPLQFDDLAEVLRSASGLNTLIWIDGMNGWERASSNRVILQRLQVPMPPPPVPQPGVRQTTLVRNRDLSFVAQSRLVEEGVKEENIVQEKYYPWRRFFARTIDLWLVAIVFGFTIGLALEPKSELSKLIENNAIASIIFTLLLIPLEGFFLGMFGTTLGKALYGISVRQNSDEPLTIRQSFWRASAACFRGMGLGIPIVYLFTAYSAYKSLLKNGVTTWDDEGAFKIEHSPFGWSRICVLGLTWVAILALMGIGIAAK